MGALVALAGFGLFFLASAVVVDRWYDDIQLWIKSLEDRLYSRGRW